MTLNFSGRDANLFWIRILMLYKWTVIRFDVKKT